MSLFWLSLGLMAAWGKNAASSCRQRQLMSLRRLFKSSDSSPVLFQAPRCHLQTWLGLDVYRAGKVLPVMQPGVATPPHPRQSGVWCFWQARHKSLFCFISSVLWSVRRQRGKRDYSAKFCEGNYSSVAAGASTITSLPPRHKQARKRGHICLSTHLYMKYIRMHQNKLARLHLLFFPLRVSHAQSLPYIPAIPGKTQAAWSPGDTDPHMISPQCGKQGRQERLHKR